MNVAFFALRNAKVIIFTVMVLAILGVRSYLSMPQSIFPTMSFSRIDVVVEAGDLPPEQVRAAIARPLEDAFQALPSVTSVRSTSSQGSAEFLVDFASQTLPRDDLQYIDGAVSQHRAELSAATNITSVVVNPNSEPVLSYALTSKDLSPAVLRNIALTQIVPQLYGVTGLGRVLVTGGPQTEFHINLDPAALAANGLGAGDIVKSLTETNTVQAAGAAQRFSQRYVVIVGGSLHDTASLGAALIPAKNGAAVPLAELGAIGLGVAPSTDLASYNGQAAVMINAYGLAGADTVKMADAFSKRLTALTPHLPSDIRIHQFWNQTKLIVASQSALRDAILLGAVLAIAVIALFLRDLRLTSIAAVVIPLAMAIAIFALDRTGQTLNLMSVGGLAVAVGLIIDDAIVVIENIARNRSASPDGNIDETISHAMGQIAQAMIASTAATVVVFLPLALLGGVAGFFFRALAFTLSVSLIVSLALALFVAPIVARVVLPAEPKKHARDPIAKVLDRYEPLLRWALHHRAIMAAASVGVLIVTVLLLAKLPSDFLPKMDEGQFELAYTMPTGTSLGASDAAARRMEAVVGDDPAVASVGRMTGIDSNGFSPTQPSQGILHIALTDPSKRASYEEVSGRLRESLAQAIPSAVFDFRQILEDLINDLSGTPAPIEISVLGSDQATLMHLAEEITIKISAIHGIVDASNGIVYDSPSLRLEPRGASLAASGLAVSDLSDAASALTEGTVATTIPQGAMRVPVRILISPSRGASDAVLGVSTSLLAKGSLTTLGALADLQTVRLSSDLNALNGRAILRVTANTAGIGLSAITADLKRVLAGIAVPPGYAVEIGGQIATQQQSFSEFINVIAVAVALVFTVMLATFRSFRLPFVILSAIPLALIGVALSLSISGTPFNISSFMGLLLLVGIVVKNGILLIDVANQRRQAGDTVEEALVAAGKTRLRPIVMTTLAAIGGLIPLAIGIGQGAEMEKPLAIAVIGGLSTATIFTLVVIPVFYAAVDTKKARAA